MKQEITRFAPSPTGHLHLGGARTALFAWLQAKASNGKFLIRFEDTDKERSNKIYIESILSSLLWLGIRPDENPVFQSQKFSSYQKVAFDLLSSGKAYSCNCTTEQLEIMRQNQIKNKLQPRYDGLNRNKKLTHKEGNVIRFKMPENGNTHFKDKILGNISVENKELDDFIILRSDSSPTYNFCAALDDFDMNISTVIRGDDHITNTLKQINILNSLNAKLPEYAHLPMVLSAEGKRLSKRNGADDINDFKEKGYLKEAMINYLIKLGWTYKEQEIFSKEELINFFDISNVNKSAAKFSHELLDFYNNHYLKTLDLENLIKLIKNDFNLPKKFLDLEKNKEIINLVREGSNNIKHLIDNLNIFYEDPLITKKMFSDFSINKEIFLNFKKKLLEVDFSDKSFIEIFLKEFMSTNNLRFPDIGKPLRLILTGTSNAPSIVDLLYLIGKKPCIERIENFLKL